MIESLKFDFDLIHTIKRPAINVIQQTFGESIIFFGNITKEHTIKDHRYGTGALQLREHKGINPIYAREISNLLLVRAQHLMVYVVQRNMNASSNCRRAGSSVGSIVYVFEKADVTIDDPNSSLKSYKDSDTKSGNTITRQFCANCGW